MKNFIQEGERMTWTNSTGSSVAAGQPVHVGNFTCVAVGTIADTATGELARCGVYEFTKAAPLAVAHGDNVFWNTTDKKVTKTASDKYLGVAFKAAASNDTTIQVQIADAGGEINKAAFVAQVTTANGSDAATTQALANALKTTMNDVLTALKNADLMASS